MHRWPLLWFIVFSLSSLLFSASSFARERVGRLGVGMNNQFINGVPAISFKLQRSPGFAMGLLAGVDTDSDDGGMGAGFKIYKILFEEPNLNFYLLADAAYLTDRIQSHSYTGYQFDFGAGTEFNFSGVESLGLSVEFGLSLNKLENDFRAQTMGSSMIVAGAHFYL